MPAHRKEKSAEEADAYRTALMNLLEEMDQAIVTPIFSIHPELRPTCCCTDSEEDEADLQP